MSQCTNKCLWNLEFENTPAVGAIFFLRSKFCPVSKSGTSPARRRHFFCAARSARVAAAPPFNVR
jgi:hypothetical protein